MGEKTMRIIFIEAGESPVPGVGVFNAGDERELPVDVAMGFIKQGVAREAAPNGENKRPVKAAEEV